MAPISTGRADGSHRLDPRLLAYWKPLGTKATSGFSSAFHFGKQQLVVNGVNDAD